MILSSSVVSMAADRAEMMEEMIVQQAIALDDKTDWTGHDFTVITLNDNGTERTLAGISGIKAIQTVDEEDEMTRVTTIIPYTLTEDGLVNSFVVNDNDQKQSRDFSYTDPSVEFTLTITARFDKISRMGSTYYRHKGVEAYWSASTSNIVVYNLNVLFGSNGNLLSYPDCVNDANAALIQADYYTKSNLQVSSPISGVKYEQFDPMPDNQVLQATKVIEHGGAVAFDLTYSVSGTRKSFADNFGVFSK